MAALEKLGAVVLLGLGAIYTPGLLNVDIPEIFNEDSVIVTMVNDTKDNFGSFTERAQGLEAQQRDFNNSIDRLNNR